MTRKKQSTTVRELQRKLTLANEEMRAAKKLAEAAEKRVRDIFAGGALVRFTKQTEEWRPDEIRTRYEARVMRSDAEDKRLCIDVSFDRYTMRMIDPLSSMKNAHQSARRQLAEALLKEMWPL